MVKLSVLLHVLSVSGIIATPPSALTKSCAFEDFIVSAVGTAVTDTLRDLSDSVQDLTQVIHGLRREIKELKKISTDFPLKPETTPILETTPAPQTTPMAETTPMPETTPAPQTKPLFCDQNNGYEYSSNTNSHYKLHMVTKSWQDANKTCLSEGATLAIVNGPAEATLLSAMLEKTHLKYASLGVYLDSALKTWKTVSGMTVQQTGYEVWGENEPWDGDAWQYGTLGDDGKLYTGNAVPMPFICEKSPEDSVHNT